MRPFVLFCLLSLAGCAQEARVEAFTATGPTSFLYAARTNTVMPANDDGTAEAIRRYWIADAVQAHALCLQGYAVDIRRFVPDPVGNGGAILYEGRCLQEPAPPPIRVEPEYPRGERG